MVNNEMKYYWIASTIEIKTAVLPCREINTNNCVIFADFKSFYWLFLLNIFDNLQGVLRGENTVSF